MVANRDRSISVFPTCPKCDNENTFSVLVLQLHEYDIISVRGRVQSQQEVIRQNGSLLQLRCHHCGYQATPEFFGLLGTEVAVWDSNLLGLRFDSINPRGNCTYKIQRTYTSEEEATTAGKLDELGSLTENDLDKFPQYLVDKHPAVRKFAKRRFDIFRRIWCEKDS